MLGPIFKKVDDLFAYIDAEIKAIDAEFARRMAGSRTKVKRVRIEHKNGDITITGEYKSLTINGKLVRLPESRYNNLKPVRREDDR